MNSYFWEDLWDIVFPFLIILLVLFILIFGGNQLAKHSCKVTAEEMHLTWKYNIWTPCLVKVDGRWIDIENYNEVGVK